MYLFRCSACYYHNDLQLHKYFSQRSQKNTKHAKNYLLDLCETLRKIFCGLSVKYINIKTLNINTINHLNSYNLSM